MSLSLGEESNHGKIEDIIYQAWEALPTDLKSKRLARCFVCLILSLIVEPVIGQGNIGIFKNSERPQPHTTIGQQMGGKGKGKTGSSNIAPVEPVYSPYQARPEMVYAVIPKSVDDYLSLLSDTGSVSDVVVLGDGSITFDRRNIDSNAMHNLELLQSQGLDHDITGIKQNDTEKQLNSEEVLEAAQKLVTLSKIDLIRKIKALQTTNKTSQFERLAHVKAFNLKIFAEYGVNNPNADLMIINIYPRNTFEGGKIGKIIFSAEDNNGILRTFVADDKGNLKKGNHFQGKERPTQGKLGQSFAEYDHHKDLVKITTEQIDRIRKSKQAAQQILASGYTPNLEGFEPIKEDITTTLNKLEEDIALHEAQTQAIEAEKQEQEKSRYEESTSIMRTPIDTKLKSEIIRRAIHLENAVVKSQKMATQFTLQDLRQGASGVKHAQDVGDKWVNMHGVELPGNIRIRFKEDLEAQKNAIREQFRINKMDPKRIKFITRTPEKQQVREGVKFGQLAKTRFIPTQIDVFYDGDYWGSATVSTEAERINLPHGVPYQHGQFGRAVLKRRSVIADSSITDISSGDLNFMTEDDAMTLTKIIKDESKTETERYTQAFEYMLEVIKKDPRVDTIMKQYSIFLSTYKNKGPKEKLEVLRMAKAQVDNNTTFASLSSEEQATMRRIAKVKKVMNNEAGVRLGHIDPETKKTQQLYVARLKQNAVMRNTNELPPEDIKEDYLDENEGIFPSQEIQFIITNTPEHLRSTAFRELVTKFHLDVEEVEEIQKRFLLLFRKELEQNSDEIYESQRLVWTIPLQNNHLLGAWRKLTPSQRASFSQDDTTKRAAAIIRLRQLYRHEAITGYLPAYIGSNGEEIGINDYMRAFVLYLIENDSSMSDDEKREFGAQIDRTELSQKI